MSPFSAREAVKLGYTNVKVLSSGLPGWKKAKGLVVLPTNGLKKMINEDESYVLIDLRPKEAAIAGHIKGAVNFPMEPTWLSRWQKKGDLENLLGTDKNRAVVFY